MISSARTFGLASVAALMFGASAQAATLTDDFDEWQANAGPNVYNTTALGSDFQQPLVVTLLGGGSFSATDALTGDSVGSVYTIGSSWGTWSGYYAGQVLYSNDQNSDNITNSVTLSLSGLSAFGFEVQPLDQDLYYVQATLASGDTLTDYVSGFGGAQFFGVYGGDLTSLTITTEDNAFAFGDFYSSPSLSPVPLPAAAPLFGLALLALAGFSVAFRRRGDGKGSPLAG